MKYHDMNCSTDVPTAESSIIRRDFDRAGKAVILATCAFYRTRWYECYGVADCGRGEGITHCAGAAPWRGYFEGTPQTGFRGNITAEAMNSPPMPDLTVSAPILAPLPENPQVPPAVKRKILYTCEKFFDSDAACSSVAQECWNGPSGRRSCKTTRLPYTRSSRNEHIFTKFDEIVKGISQQSIDASASGIVVSCYFYSSTDYVCGVPFAVDFNGSSRVRPADGSFFSGSS
ncbi:hypothetical protein BV898_12868 [Hypsibius exemplaris]|uniref:Uncharacterized protein n=1 Tax=Hypsibius exemplaris TaxID=2072580 RepID=A0A1W0WCE2_HYPEX|nr:hypothetical protein BV898_12868 [Hypsibius exemplaris]